MKRFRWFRMLVVASVVVAPGLVAVGAASCGGVSAQTVVNTGTTIASDVCTAAATAPAEPGWVKLVCQDEADASKLITVIIPLVQWAEIQASGLKSRTTLPVSTDGGTSG